MDSNLVLSMSTISLLISHCLRVHPRYTWSRKDVGSPKSTSSLGTFHIGSFFASFPPIWWHPQTQITVTLFHGVRISIPNWKLSPNGALSGFSQIAFPTTVLPKGDRTDFAQEEWLDLPYWTMIWTICVVVDESNCLDIPIWEFSRIWVHPPFWPEKKQILRQLLVLSILAVWIWWPWLLRRSYVMLMIRALRILHKIQNHLSQFRLGVQLDLCIFGALPPVRQSSNDRGPSMKRGVLVYLLFLLHRSLLSYFWLSSGSTPEIFSSFSHSLSTAAFAASIFIAWGIGINLCTKIVML